MARTCTRDALLEQGAALMARHGVGGVTTRQLHEAAGTRNESALHYHFGGREGLVAEILRVHLAAVEARRAPLVAAIAADARQGDLRALVHALAAPLVDDLGTPRGRSHLRLVAQLNHPSLAYVAPFRLVDAPAGRAVTRWLREALGELPEPIRRERLAAVREQLIGLLAARARLLDEHDGGSPPAPDELFLANLLDMVVAGLAAPPSAAARAAAHDAAASDD